MADFQANVIIAEPVEIVFSYMANLKNAPVYMDKVKETTKLTEGPIGKGTKYQEIRIVRGKEAVAEIEFLYYEENKTYTTRSHSNGLLVDYHYRFTEIAEGTKVEFTAKVHVAGFWMRLTKRLLINILKGEDGDHLHQVKVNLEKEEHI
ncbi:SRPBCC family protein [Niallia sp. NCCP-28]|uniref:SRPBCC family protein n=1 Tax=Niallia sp. NCCP-28 TaxID=2934712 RepID=UPI00208526B3|nr:SRPBCC family protein [Niallia sp. NCCP-28]GKU83731.1 hypothetical protein NCCP28_31270 [Niallia sp. NCCP-28]